MIRKKSRLIRDYYKSMMASTKNEMMWKLLSKNAFNLKNSVNEDLLCVACKDILINAHQVPCGCRFCQTCIEKYVKNGNKCCPGNQDECINQMLTKETVSIDYYINNVISKLKVKCINNECSYEDELRNIGEHMQSCAKNNLDCVKNETKFCRKSMVKIDEIICSLDNLNESLNDLREKELLNRVQVECLKYFVVGNIVNTKELCKEMIEKEMEKLKCQYMNENEKIISRHLRALSILEEASKREEFEIRGSNNEVETVKKEYSDHFNHQMEIYLEAKICDFINKMRMEQEKEMRHIQQQYFILCQMNKEECFSDHISISDVKSKTNLNIREVWEVKNVMKRIKKGEVICSNKLKMDGGGGCGYKINMLLCFNGDFKNDQPHVTIELFFDEEQSGVAWPLKATVSVGIKDEIFDTVCISEVHECSVGKAEWSPMFNFLCADIVKENAIRNDTIVVECLIEFV